MAGAHRRCGGRPARRTRFVLAGAALAVLVAVVAAGALRPAAAPSTPTGAATSLPTTPGGPYVAVPDRATDHPSRGGGPRGETPQASPAAPATREAPADVPDGGDVVTTGSCEASYYWEPQPTASGEVFDPEAMTAAHLTWDFGTRVRVTNPATGSAVTVRINDRGPYVGGRCLDLSRGAFREIAPLDQGVATVTYEVLAD